MTKSTIFLFAAFFVATVASAQLQRAHQYPSHSLKRIILDSSGETYVLDDSCSISIFNANHEFLKTKYLQGAGDSYISCTINLLSEALIDSDPDLDIFYSWAYIGEDVFGARLEDENNPPVNFQGPAKLLKIPGQPNKLLTGTTVWGIPGMVEEHDYGYQQVVSRNGFAIGGEHYVSYKAYGGFDGFHFYNAQHQFVKTVNLPFPQFQYYSFITQQLFNTDSLIEFCGMTWEGDILNQRTCRIAREDGVILFEKPCFRYETSVLPNKNTYFMLVHYVAPDVLETQFYNPQTMALVATLPGQATRILTGLDEEVFFCRQPGGNQTLLCYDANFQLIKSFEVPSLYGHFWNEGVSRNRFSSTGELEFRFTYQTAQNATSVVILRADGQTLYHFQGARTGVVDHQSGIKDKFFVYYPDSTVVYNIINEALDAADPGIGKSWAVSPNPFGHSLHVELPGATGLLWVFDGSGRETGTYRINQQGILDINTAAWPSGIYWIRWQSGGKAHCAKVVKGR
ncbi:MAG: T9SS type A sorting domain-containing protein [Saprospiraceae bacterium]|nr:T9SS type A sorting domain-containing protein [Saprospiraceae bacterium]